MNKEILEKLNKLDVLDEIRSTMNRLESTQEELLRASKAIEDEVKTVKAEVDNNQKRIKKVSEVCDDHSKTIKNLLHRVNFLEKAQRRRNMLIFNLDEKENDNVSLLSLVESLFQDILGAPKVPGRIILCRRLGKPKAGNIRPVLLEFQTFDEKMTIMYSSGKLAGSKISLSHDYTIQEQEERKKLLFYKRLIHEDGFSAKLRGMHLLVNGEFLNVRELQSRFKGFEDKRKREESGSDKEEKRQKSGM